ncbi:aconitase A [Streptococcus suis]|nr:aconitase A [Streptococcus suis]CYU93865.1 aconitase A [Streptococcus suis]
MEKTQRKRLFYKGEEYSYYALESISMEEKVDIHSLPYTIRILLESLLRKEDGVDVTKNHIMELLHYQAASPKVKGKFLLNLVVLFCKILQVFLLW